MSAENKKLLETYHAAWSQGHLDNLRLLLDDRCVTYDLVTGKARPVEFELQACQIWHASFSDVQVHIQQMVAEDDKVSVYWQLTSTHTGDFMNIAATHKQVLIPGMEINRITNGKLIEIWRLSDTMSVMQQLGAMD